MFDERVSVRQIAIFKVVVFARFVCEEDCCRGFFARKDAVRGF